MHVVCAYLVIDLYSFPTDEFIDVIIGNRVYLKCIYVSLTLALVVIPKPAYMFVRITGVWQWRCVLLL